MDNVCIILLIILMVYLIYKISNNTCECFDSQINCSHFTSPLTCGTGTSSDCEWNYSTRQCGETLASQEKISLKPENPSQFLARINEAYGDSKSKGVFISMIIPGPGGSGGMDGSGSVLHKDTYTDTYMGGGSNCTFGFIWDTTWWKTALVECLFSKNVGSSFIVDFECDPPNFCKLANTSGDNTPDRCSAGLYYFNGFKEKNPDFPNPTSCAQKKIYDLDEMKRVEFENNKNCFTYIDHELNNKEFTTDFNEGVFLKDVIWPLEHQEGIRRLKESKKPLPSALLFVYNDKVDDYCTKNVDYINKLEGLKSNFTPDTMVVKARFDMEKQSIISFDNIPTTLGEMS